MSNWIEEKRAELQEPIDVCNGLTPKIREAFVFAAQFSIETLVFEYCLEIDRKDLISLADEYDFELSVDDQDTLIFNRKG